MKLLLKSNKYISILLLLFIFFGCKSGSSNQKKESKGITVVPESSLTFISETGEEMAELKIALADEQSERNQGLMDVQTLPADTGMLFIFETEGVKSFYMRNTPLPLDIMYVNRDSVIVRIYQNTTPFSEAGLPSELPALYVVETNGGYSIANGITEGMKIRF